MPSFTSSVDRSSEAGFLFRSELPVVSVRAMLPFFPQALRVRRSLDETIDAGGGLLAYDLVADLRAKRFTVSSAWVDQASFEAWVATPVHVDAMKRLRSKVEGGTFETETVKPVSPAA